MKQKTECNWARWRWLRQHLKPARKSPHPEQPEARIAHFLTTIFAAIPLITASIYLTGMAYRYGACQVHGLDIAEFQWPADITLATGFLQWLTAVKEYMWPLLYIVLGAMALIVVMYFCVRQRLGWAWILHRLCSRPFPKIRRFFRRRARVPAPKLYFLFAWLKILYDRFAILVLPSLIALLPAYVSFNQGKEAAQTQVIQLESGQLTAQSGRALSPLLGDSPHIRLMCNATHCAYRLKGGEVRLVRHDQVEQVKWMATKDDADTPPT